MAGEAILIVSDFTPAGCRRLGLAGMVVRRCDGPGRIVAVRSSPQKPKEKMKLRGHLLPDIPREHGNPPTQAGGLLPDESRIDEKIAQHLRLFTQNLIEELDSHYRLLHERYVESYMDVEEVKTADAATILDLVPQSQNSVQIETILAYVGTTGAGQQALIRLGNSVAADHRIVIPQNTLTQLTGLRVRLSNTDKRRISAVVVTNGVPGTEGGGASAFLYLALFGRQIPTGSLMWG